jgi:hypothetical protein
VNSAQLKELVRKERRKVLGSIDYTAPGVPMKGKFGESVQRDIVCRALHRHAVRHGQIEFGSMVIGVSPSTRHMSGLRSTNSVGLRLLIEDLRESVMGGFVEEIMRRWEKCRVDRGDFVPESEQTDSERFSHTHFRGFD